MVCLKKIIPYTKGGVRLVFTGCQHYGSKQFLRDEFKSFLDKYLKEDHSYLFIMGDLFDAIVASDSKRYDPFNNKTNLINKVIDEIIEDLSPYQEKIIGICSGNHEYQYLKRYNISLTQLICDKLKTQNLGISFLLKLFLKRNGKDKVRNITIYGHHGYGGGGRINSSINRYLRKMEEFEADVYVFAHDHFPWHIKLPKVGVNSAGKMVCKEIYLIGVGSFKRSFLPSNSKENTITWEEVKGFGPYIKGGKVIDVIPNSSSGVIINPVF